MEISGHAFSRDFPAETQVGARRDIDNDAGVDGSHARPAGPRPGAGAGRVDLVGGDVGQPHRADQSQHRRSHGIQVAGKCQAPHRDSRPRRQHLVHGKQQRHHRQTRSAHGDDHRIQNAGPRSQRSAHGDFRQERQLVVHLAGEQHGRPLGSGDGRDQAGENADGQIRALTASC